MLGFGGLKKRLSDSVKKLSERLSEKPAEIEDAGKIRERVPEAAEKTKRPEAAIGLKERKITEAVGKREEPAKEKGGIFQKTLKESDIDDFFSDNEMGLLESNVALEVVDEMKAGLKEKLADKPVKRIGGGDAIRKAFEETIAQILDQGEVDISRIIREAKESGTCACFVFMGFNGSGKTTSIAKFAQFLTKKGYRVMLAAGDTFRAASIEQLEHHANRLGLKMIKHKYGADSAAVIFDAVKHGSKNDYDAILADTAGRSHADKNLMDELKKVVRVNRPQLKVLVIDSLTGNDAVEQARRFNDAVGIDAVVLTKTDVNTKGGSILSVCQAIKKPILFLGTGQKYEDIDIFNPEKFAEELLGGD